MGVEAGGHEEVSDPHDADTVADAFRIVLQQVANWRREALREPGEYDRRDRLLRELEQIGLDVRVRLTGSVL